MTTSVLKSDWSKCIELPIQHAHPPHRAFGKKMELERWLSTRAHTLDALPKDPILIPSIYIAADKLSVTLVKGGCDTLWPLQVLGVHVVFLKATQKQ